MQPVEGATLNLRFAAGTRAPHLLSRVCGAAYAPHYVERDDAREDVSDGHENSSGLFFLRSG
jgi:hypothetical protein